MRTKLFIYIPALFCLLLACQPVRATTWTVTSAADSGAGTLRDIISGQLHGGDTVQFDSSLSGQTILLTSGEIQLDQNMTIDASALSVGITINGNHNSRIFEVFTNVTATLTCLTIVNGYAAAGAGIYNTGTLTNNRCTIAGNALSSQNGAGGGIYNNRGTLTLNQCTVANNSATFGGGAGGNDAGGGIFNLSSGKPVTLNQCTVSGNSATVGGGGFASATLFNTNYVIFFNSIVAGNTAGTGADVDSSTTPFLRGTNFVGGNPLLAPLGNHGGPTPTMPPLPGSPVIDGGSDSATGAPYNFTIDQRGFPRLVSAHVDIGAVEADYLVVTTNADSGPGSLRAAVAAAAGADIIFAPNLSGQTILLTSGEIDFNNSMNIDASALPGGIQINGNHASQIFVVRSGTTVLLNSLTLTNGVAPSGANFGGGIATAAATLTLTKCTLTGNSATAGGGIYNFGQLILNECTVAGNSAQTGGGIEGQGLLTLNQSTVAGNSATSGSGIRQVSSTLYLFNTIVASNTGSADISNSGSSVYTGTNFIGGNPLLAPLGNYGGPTPTMPPLAGSPVMDTGSDSATIAIYGFITDQRGQPRVWGHVDIGAVEINAVLTNANAGPGSLRDACSHAFPGEIITFDPSLSGQTILLTSGVIDVNISLNIDASALPAGIKISGNRTSQIFFVHNATVGLNSLTLTSGFTAGSPGGAIESYNSVLTLTKCTVTGSFTAGFVNGGGIWSNDQLILNQCTVTGNSAFQGGGIEIDYGQVTLNQCTVTGNSANYGSAFYSGNSYPLYLYMFNSIVAGNTGAGDIEHDNNNDLTIVLTGTNFIGGDPKLAPLGNYGGTTPTMPPLPGSPVIDAGSNSATGAPYNFTTDQRGFQRLIGPHVDIGAAEFYASAVTTNADSGPGSLRYLIPYALPGFPITFATNLSGQTITLTSGAISLSNTLSIDASALSSSVIVSGNNSSGIFNVGTGASVWLTGLTLENGNQYDGGAVYGAAGSSVTLTRCTVTGNLAVEGGGLLNDGAMVVNECTLANNFGSYGGAMQSRGNTTISQCTVSGNTGYYGGGGFWVGSAAVIVSNSIVAGNLAPGSTTSNQDIEIVTGPLTYSSSNLVQFASGVTPTGPAPMTNAPQLLPLGNYGGPTQTMPPFGGSPALDAGGPTALTIDQRGFPRVSGAAPDLGAVEAQVASQAPVLKGASRSPNGPMLFQFTNLVGGSFTVFASTNVALPFNTWSNLGPAVESPAGSGQFQFTDPQATNNPRRFYRVHSP